MTEIAAGNVDIQTTAVDAETQTAAVAMTVRMIMTADAEASSALNPVLSKDPLCSTRTLDADVMSHKIRNY